MLEKHSSNTVVHVIVGLNRGGAERVLVNLLKHFPALNKSNQVVISLTDEGVYKETIVKAGASLYCLNITRNPVSTIRGFFVLTSLLRRINPVIVQTWMVHSDLIGGLAAWFASVPKIVWGVRTTDFSVESRMTRIVRWFCARLSRLIPDRIICAAQASLDSSVQAGYDRQKMMVIPNGFDTKVLHACLGKGVALRKSIGFSDTAVVVGCVGRYNPAKDHANFVRAAALLAAENPNVRFLMVGRNVDHSNSVLKALVDATGFADRFILLGESEEPASCIDAMDIFVLSSCTEGFPNVLGEAMAMGVPCVTTDVGDAALLVGDTAYVVPAKDPRALAKAVNRLLEMSSSERQYIGDKCRQRLIDNFSIAAIATLFSQVYRDLIANTDMRIT